MRASGLLMLTAALIHPSDTANVDDVAPESCGAKALLQLQSSRGQTPAVSAPEYSFEEGSSRKRLLVVVPGHGDERRTQVLADSLLVVQNTFPDFVCMVFSYKSEEEFPLNFADFGLPQCQVVRGAGVNLEFLKRVPQKLVNQSDFVFTIQDDVQLYKAQPAVNLTEMSLAMDRNSLDMVSPSLLHTNWKYQVPQVHTSGKIGRRVPVVEFQANLFTRDAFKTLQELVRPDISKCYGYANLYPSFFEAAHGREPRFGLVDTMLADHLQGQDIPSTNAACDPSLTGQSLIETFRSYMEIPQAAHTSARCWNPTCTNLWTHYEAAGIYPVPFDESLMGATLEELEGIESGASTM
jgi:hypothetical protein